MTRTKECSLPSLVMAHTLISCWPDSLVECSSNLTWVRDKESSLSWDNASNHTLRCPHQRLSSNANTLILRDWRLTSWLYGFKLHWVVDDCSNILSFTLTSGNTDDRKPVSTLLKTIVGTVFGDRGYISKTWTTSLAEQGIEWITSLKKNMKTVTHDTFDVLMLRKRSIIETINDRKTSRRSSIHATVPSPTLWLTLSLAWWHLPIKTKNQHWT